MAWLWGWLATRAASGWIALVGFAAIVAALAAYDYRGDRIAGLELDLLQCQGTAKQAKTIRELSERITEELGNRAENEIDQLNQLPADECYRLDDPSPLDRVRKSAGTAKQDP